MSTLKAGTVCYIAGAITWPELVGRVVTLTGVTRRIRGRTEYEFQPYLRTRGKLFGYGSRRSLVPISDPDQPVDVTSDADQPVTA